MKKQTKMKIGDVVMLRSGGPATTIVGEQTGGGRHVWDCGWWYDTSYSSARFPEATLRLVKSADPAGR